MKSIEIVRYQYSRNPILQISIFIKNNFITELFWIKSSKYILSSLNFTSKIFLIFYRFLRIFDLSFFWPKNTVFWSSNRYSSTLQLLVTVTVFNFKNVFMKWPLTEKSMALKTMFFVFLLRHCDNCRSFIKLTQIK